MPDIVAIGSGSELERVAWCIKAGKRSAVLVQYEDGTPTGIAENELLYRRYLGRFQEVVEQAAREFSGATFWSGIHVGLEIPGWMSGSRSIPASLLPPLKAHAAIQKLLLPRQR